MITQDEKEAARRIYNAMADMQADCKAALMEEKMIKMSILLAIAEEIHPYRKAARLLKKACRKARHASTMVAFHETLVARALKAARKAGI